MVGVVQITTASKEDTLPDIARRFNVGYEEIVRANPGVDPWIPGVGRTRRGADAVRAAECAARGHRHQSRGDAHLLFSQAQARRAAAVYTHPIGVGKVGWCTPEGVTQIVSREENPTWRPSAGVRKEHADNDDPLPAVVPPGPDNPLGKYKFTLGWPSYLIHGTNKPYGVGLRSSHGCIRLYPEDIAEDSTTRCRSARRCGSSTSRSCSAGTTDTLYLQAYTVLEDDARDWSKAQKKLLLEVDVAAPGKAAEGQSGTEIDWDAVTRVVARAARDRGAGQRRGGQRRSVLAAAPVVQNRIPDGSNWDGADEVETTRRAPSSCCRNANRSAVTTGNAAQRKPGG